MSKSTGSTVFQEVRNIWTDYKKDFSDAFPKKPGGGKVAGGLASILDILGKKPERFYAFRFTNGKELGHGVAYVSEIREYIADDDTRELDMFVHIDGLHHHISSTPPWGPEETTIDTYVSNDDLYEAAQYLTCRQVNDRVLTIETMEYLESADNVGKLEEDGIEKVTLVLRTKGVVKTISGKPGMVSLFVEKAIGEYTMLWKFVELRFEYDDGSICVITGGEYETV